MCGEFSDSCGGHVPRDLQERLQKRAADSWHVYSVLLYRSHHVYRGKGRFHTVSMNVLIGASNKQTISILFIYIYPLVFG